MAKQRQEDGKKGVVDLMPLFAKELLAGGVAGGFAKTVVAPLERVKILFQVPQDSYFTSYSFYSFSSFGGRGWSER